MRILAVEPYYGGSHQAFLDSIVRLSRHEWTLVTGPARHWKWRMRNAPLAMALQTKQILRTGDESGQPPFDLLFTTDMMDLPQWRGFMSGYPNIAPETPSVVYFHENQWTYPKAPQAREDFHFGYTNLLTAVAADEVWFNSQHHLDTFYDASERFLKRMPDNLDVHHVGSLRNKSIVIPAGFDALEPIERTRTSQAPPADLPTITLGWVGRWEDDKRPDRFLELLDRLAARKVVVRLVLLGPRPSRDHPALTALRERHSASILHDGYAIDDYHRWLSQIDVVVSTADHEFFGIAVCEAIWAGAIPMLPNRLSYPELADPDSLYDDLDDAVLRIEAIARATPQQRRTRQDAARQRIADYQTTNIVPRIDDCLERVAHHNIHR